MPTLIDRKIGTAHWAGAPEQDKAQWMQPHAEEAVAATRRHLLTGPQHPYVGSPCDQVTVPAPLLLWPPATAVVEPTETWVEAWMPQSAYDQLCAGQAADIRLAGALNKSYRHIDGTVTQVVSGNNPGVTGSRRCCRVQIRPRGAFFIGRHTYHPLLPGVAIQVALRTASESLISLLAAVRSRST